MKAYTLKYFNTCLSSVANIDNYVIQILVSPQNDNNIMTKQNLGPLNPDRLLMSRQAK